MQSIKFISYMISIPMLLLRPLFYQTAETTANLIIADNHYKAKGPAITPSRYFALQDSI